MDTYKHIESKSLPLMTDYQRDLTYHDKKIIDGNPGIPFIHITKNMGTNLVLMPPADHQSWPEKGESVPYLFSHADREHILKQKQEVLPAFMRWDTVDIIQYFDGKRVREITEDETHVIVRDYINNILNIWEGE